MKGFKSDIPRTYEQNVKCIMNYTTEPTHVESYESLPPVTVEQLTLSILKSCNGDKNIKDNVNNMVLDVINHLGYSSRTMDFHLDKETRKTFFKLEDIGLVKSSTDYGKIQNKVTDWRTTWWVLRKDVIHAIDKDEVEEIPEQEKIEQIYNEIPNYVWERKAVTY
ncbi:MAG: hypothetical protein KJ906_03895 [Nanoarchaeota archaeon]|nr:hypothetical protein [Nanoarchaeota archaeon]